MQTLYLAITNHGFGHATRASAVAATILQQCPEIRIIVATTAPQWLLQSYLLSDRVSYRSKSFDIGVLQRDSLTMDKAATLSKLDWIRTHQDELLAEEIEFVRQAQVDLVLADIPPLAANLAKAADIPCWMMSNFGWDFIYRPWEGFEAIATWISDCFSQCDRLFRLPFHEPMSAFPDITDVGLTGGTPRYRPAELRQRYDLSTPSDRTVLLTFGGLGLAQMPYTTLNDFPDWQFITFDQEAPELPNLLKVNDRSMRPVDFMPLCDRILSKPGYSTFSEACRLQKGILTIPRDDFAEATLLLNGIQDHAHHLILEADAFFQGDWSFLHQPLQAPRSHKTLDRDGNGAIATAVINHLSR
jgi:hypothetical protein